MPESGARLSTGVCSERRLQGSPGHTRTRSESSPPASAELYRSINKPFKKS